MDLRVFEFAKVMQSNAPFADDGAIEWHLSGEPVDYRAAVAAMEERARGIADGKALELVWFLEHPALYTAGTSARASGLHDAARFPVYTAGRGGQYTYHGPGQLVIYVMLDLNRRGRDVRRFVRLLEDWAIAALAPYGIEGHVDADRPGVWVKSDVMPNPAKIAAIGVRVRRWVTYHGISVNVCPDLGHFDGIVPCGIVDAGVTSIADLADSSIAALAALTPADDSGSGSVNPGDLR